MQEPETCDIVEDFKIPRIRNHLVFETIPTSWTPRQRSPDKQDSGLAVAALELYFF
jgi:hypothetical protein